jgi:hypothetical protein
LLAWQSQALRGGSGLRSRSTIKLSKNAEAACLPLCIISRDKAKTQTYCQIADLGEQMDQAGQEKDNKKIEELAQKLPELEKNLGPEYIGLVDFLRNVDLTSKDRDDIVSIFDELDEACPD